MRWLEGSKDETECKIREGLDFARDRTDELSLRRAWSRLAEPELFPTARRWWPWMVASGGLLSAAAAAVLVLVPAGAGREAPGARAPEAATAAVLSSAAAASAPSNPGLAVDTTVEVVGPATVRTGVHQQKRLRLRGGARVELDSQTVFAVDAGQRPAVQAGRARLSVPRQAKGEHFTVAVGPYVIVVVGTVFDVGLESGMAEVAVTEGVVEVWHDGDVVRLTPGATWKGPASAQPSGRRPWSIGRRRGAAERRVGLASTPPATALRRLEGREGGSGADVSAPAPTLRPSDRFRDAKAALADGQTERGMSILWSLAEGTGPVAENASYELGRALRDQLTSPREAIEAWNRYRTRFPRGLLRAEADISILETLLSVGDRGAALAEADAFVRRHPQSERRAEVERLAERLRLSAEARAAGGL
jgi:hypothetical protein